MEGEILRVEHFAKILDADFYTGVPDSQLKSLCNYLMNTYGIDSQHHIIAANEGNCVAIAAGYYLATGKVPVVYMQNSGEGNIINPVTSLINEKVYGIPIIFVIGWRGEPGVHDEPQHIFQGEITQKLLKDIEIESFTIGKDTKEEEVREAKRGFNDLLSKGKSVAFIIRKGSFSYCENVDYSNGNVMLREAIIQHIVRVSGDDPIVSTTGKASRELFSIRTASGKSHSQDFLTIGSMGHSSSIAMGVALHKPDTKIWCIDGDGAAIMHMGAIAVIGAHAPANMIHVVINNGAHETVGGQPTVAKTIDLAAVAKACGYPNTVCVDNFEDLDKALKMAKEKHQLSMIEVQCAIGARDDLGRPTISTMENKKNFMEYLKGV